MPRSVSCPEAGFHICAENGRIHTHMANKPSRLLVRLFSLFPFASLARLLPLLGCGGRLAQSRVQDTYLGALQGTVVGSGRHRGVGLWTGEEGKGRERAGG